LNDCYEATITHSTLPQARIDSINTKCAGANTTFKFKKSECAADTVKRPLSDLKTPKSGSSKNCFYIQDGFIDDNLWETSNKSIISEFKTTATLVSDASIPSNVGSTP